MHQLNEINKYHIHKQYKILNDEEEKRVKSIKGYAPTCMDQNKKLQELHLIID